MATGLGKVDPTTPPGEYDKQYLHTDVAVIGGGPSRISAALSAAKQGVRVIVFDSEPALGGHLRYQSNSALHELKESISKYENIEIFTNTTVQGIYEDNWLSATRGNRLFKIRSKSTILATGAYEIPLVFENNDLPGVMLGSAVQRLLHLYGVNPGNQILIVTTNEDGWRLGGDLQTARIKVAAIVEERSSEDCNRLHLNKFIADHTPVYFEHTVLKAVGSSAVKGENIVRIDSDGSIDPSTKQSLQCDIIAMSVGWTPVLGLLFMAGGKTEYNEELSEIVPKSSRPPHLAVAGRVAGIHTIDQQITQSEQAGLFAFKSIKTENRDLVWTVPDITGETYRTTARVSVPGNKKEFVCFCFCFCEEVSGRDIETAITEGYNSIELLKRYSTISMGPC